jgi:WD40 repeat protein
VRSLRGHSGCVTAAAFSPDGKKLATASHDKTARVWNMVGGEELSTLANQSDIACMALSPDGRRLAIGHQDETSDKTTTVWDTTTGVPLLTLRGHSVSVSAAVFSLDGSSLPPQIATGPQKCGTQLRATNYSAFAATRIASLAWRLAMMVDVSPQRVGTIRRRFGTQPAKRS